MTPRWAWGLGAVAVAAVGYGVYRYLQPTTLEGGTYLLDQLATAPFPAQVGPAAAVVVPPGFQLDAPMRVCLYLRGFSSCVEALVGAENGPCRGGTIVHRTSNLAAQLAASGSNTVLVLPELHREAATGDPGRLAQAGSVEALLGEVLARMSPVLGARAVAHLGVMSHSGGYQAAAAVVRQRPAALRSVALLDSLYGSEADFLDWVRENTAGFGSGFRFADVYTSTGGTAAKSAQLEQSVRGLGLSVGSDLTQPIVFQHTALSHHEVTEVFPRALWSAGW